MDSSRDGRRASIKDHSINWKEKFRKNCMERAKKDRLHLIWKIRVSAQDHNPKGIVQSALRNIVTDEMKKIRDSSPSSENEVTMDSVDDNLLWECDGMQIDSSSSEFEQEDILIEMEKLLYEDLRKELVRRALEGYEEEEEYLAQAISLQLQINDEQTPRFWCPVCKQGQLSESHHLICCTHCDLQLDVEGDKVNLNVLRDRLGQAYEEHLDRGCKAAPTFCLEARFSITALYIKCQVCNALDIVL